MGLREVRVEPIATARLEAIIGPERTARFRATAEGIREHLRGRVVWNVNSTAAGGGVAELLQTLLSSVRAIGIDARWVVIAGEPGFFAITKRIHNHLYGTAGDGGALGPAERAAYEATLAPNADDLLGLVRPGDLVLLHDPQTAALARPLLAAGIDVVWRCHVGLDTQNERSELAWSFLRPYVEDVPAAVFSRAAFAPSWIPEDRRFVIPPSIDPFSTKNEPIDGDDVRRTLQVAGLVEGHADRPPAAFTRRDGSTGRLGRSVDLVGTGPPPPADVPVVLQASRWDALKDMPGVMAGFVQGLGELGDAHLVLAGPSVDGVADDPEAAAVLGECLDRWHALPEPVRRRIHLACISMTDGDEAAITVNALQRHARVVVQKSLAEGFGLTVTEAMWKARPVVGSAVGGIVDQIVPGETGHLLADPHDLDGFAGHLAALLADPDEADRLGANGRALANERFLGDRHLSQWAELVAQLA